jgi:hypothetical protein
MVEVQEFKQRITEIISQEYKIDFLGDDFDKTIERLSDTKAENIYDWVTKVAEDSIAPIMKNAKDKKYKGIPLNKLLNFRKDIQIA